MPSVKYLLGCFMDFVWKDNGLENGLLYQCSFAGFCSCIILVEYYIIGVMLSVGLLGLWIVWNGFVKTLRMGVLL